MANSKIDSLKIGSTIYDITLPADADLSITNLSVTGSLSAPSIFGSVINLKWDSGAEAMTTGTIAFTDECGESAGVLYPYNISSSSITAFSSGGLTLPTFYPGVVAGGPAVLPTIYTENIVGGALGSTLEYGSLTLTTSGYNGGILISAATLYCSLTMRGLDIYASAARSTYIYGVSGVTLSGSSISLTTTGSVVAPDIYLGSATSRVSVLSAINSLGTQVTYTYSSNILTITTK